MDTAHGSLSFGGQEDLNLYVEANINFHHCAIKFANDHMRSRVNANVIYYKYYCKKDHHVFRWYIEIMMPKIKFQMGYGSNLHQGFQSKCHKGVVLACCRCLFQKECNNNTLQMILALQRNQTTWWTSLWIFRIHHLNCLSNHFSIIVDPNLIVNHLAQKKLWPISWSKSSLTVIKSTRNQ